MEIVQTLEEVPDKISDWENIFLGSFGEVPSLTGLGSKRAAEYSA